MFSKASTSVLSLKLGPYAKNIAQIVTAIIKNKGYLKEYKVKTNSVALYENWDNGTKYSHFIDTEVQNTGLYTIDTGKDENFCHCT